MRHRFLIATLLCVPLLALYPGLRSGGADLSGMPAQATNLQRNALSFHFLLRDGRIHSGKLLSFDEKGVTLGLAAGREHLPMAKVLSFHGPAKRLLETAAVEVRLITGSRLRGKILGGDKGGESLQLLNGALQNKVISVQLDFVQLIRLPIKSQLPSLDLFAAGASDEQDDVLYQRAALGLDSVSGSLFAVNSDGLLFKPSRSRSSENLYKWKNIVALRLPQDGSMKEEQGPRLVILMQDGSRFRGSPKGVEKGVLRLQTLALGEVLLPTRSILAGHIEDKSQLSYLSDLTPTDVEELGFMKKLPRKQWRYRRDGCSVHGDYQAVRGRYWTKGLGVHSYSKLSFVVPQGWSRFVVAVGVDDCAVRGAVRANPPGLVDFRIYIDGKLVDKATAVRGGMAARQLSVLKLRSGQILTLEVDTGPDKIFTGDRANWLGPVFLR